MNEDRAAVRYGFLDVVTIGQEFYAWVQTVLTCLAKSMNMNETELRALWLCFRAESHGLTQRELVYCLQRSKTHVSLMLAAMEERGLLKSERRAPDRRRQHWRPTRRGRDIALHFSSRWNEVLFVSESGKAAVDAYAEATHGMFVEMRRGILAAEEKRSSFHPDASALDFKSKRQSAATVKPTKRPEIPARLQPYSIAARRV